MSDTILVDECLSVALVAVAKARGLSAVHVAHIGKGGWQDRNLVPFALEHDYIVATDNRRHFLKEYLKRDIHNGLIIVVPSVERDRQIALFGFALDAIAGPVVRRCKPGQKTAPSRTARPLGCGGHAGRARRGISGRCRRPAGAG